MIRRTGLVEKSTCSSCFGFLWWHTVYSFFEVSFVWRFHTHREQVLGQLVVPHALLPQGIRGILQMCPQYLYQEQIILHPLLPLQHPVVHLLFEILGCQVHGISSNAFYILPVTSGFIFCSCGGMQSSDQAVLPRRIRIGHALLCF